MMRDILKTGFILFIITAVSGLLLGFMSIVTEQPIAIQEKKLQDETMRIVLSDAIDFNEIYSIGTSSNSSKEEKKSFFDIMFRNQTTSSESVTKVQEGLENGLIKGYVFNVTSSGYAGKVEMMVGLDVSGNVTGVSILKHSETPGLGAEASKEFFTSRFKGKSEFPLSVSKSEQAGNTSNEIQAITSATITSNAVIRGVNDAYSWFSNNIRGATN